MHYVGPNLGKNGEK